MERISLNPSNVRIREMRDWLSASDGQSPRWSAEDAAERSLAQWANNRRKAYNRDSLSAAEVAEMEAIPGWTWGHSRGALWGEAFFDLQNYLKANEGRYPTQSAIRPTELRLAKWISKQRQCHASKTLWHPRTKLLEASKWSRKRVSVWYRRSDLCRE